MSDNSFSTYYHVYWGPVGLCTNCPFIPWWNTENVQNFALFSGELYLTINNVSYKPQPFSILPDNKPALQSVQIVYTVWNWLFLQCWAIWNWYCCVVCPSDCDLCKRNVKMETFISSVPTESRSNCWVWGSRMFAEYLSSNEIEFQWVLWFFKTALGKASPIGHRNGSNVHGTWQ
jgi:hypothetical protein